MIIHHRVKTSGRLESPPFLQMPLDWQHSKMYVCVCVCMFVSYCLATKTVIPTPINSATQGQRISCSVYNYVCTYMYMSSFLQTFHTTSVEKGCYNLQNEPSPALQTYVAALSGGPIGPSDHVGMANRTLILATWCVSTPVFKLCRRPYFFLTFPKTLRG